MSSTDEIEDVILRKSSKQPEKSSIPTDEYVILRKSICKLGIDSKDFSESLMIILSISFKDPLKDTDIENIELIVHLFDYEERNGYDKGFSRGYEAGCNESNVVIEDLKLKLSGPNFDDGYEHGKYEVMGSHINEQAFI